ncbi:MAG: DUF370 domain-containing protein [Oscillospiraceae bacterium]|nr:DUF370 domain-containing protein [Oscillospiraceae bacterium]MCL2279680.1 DUF370 domain-containing protein [Oscillospiraceae bacterium]
MYLHLGQNVVVSERDVIGFFDLDNTTSSFITRKFLKNAQESGLVSSASDELPRAFILCSNESNTEIHLSQLSTQALVKRIGEI